MVTGRLPWVGEDRKDIIKQIKHVRVKPPEWLSEPLREIISAMMHPSPFLRISLQNLMYATWVKTGIPRNKTEADRLREMTLHARKAFFRDKPVSGAPDGRHTAPLQRALLPPLPRPLDTSQRPRTRALVPYFQTAQRVMSRTGYSIVLGQLKRAGY
jgi:serine/threonine protein kinase